jgi:hypothetical protein
VLSSRPFSWLCWVGGSRGAQRDSQKASLVRRPGGHSLQVPVRRSAGWAVFNGQHAKLPSGAEPRGACDSTGSPAPVGFLYGPGPKIGHNTSSVIGVIGL